MGESMLLQHSLTTTYLSKPHKKTSLTTPSYISFTSPPFSRLTSCVVSDTKSPSFVFETPASGKGEVREDIGGGSGGGLGSGGKGKGKGGGGGGGEGEEGEDNNKNKKKMGSGGMSMSQKFTLGYAALVGVGGLMGYIKTGSTKSLTAGGISTLVLGYVYTALPTNPVVASAVGLGISVALLGVMGSRFQKSGKVFPAGVVSVMSLVMTAGYLHGIMRSSSH